MTSDNRCRLPGQGKPAVVVDLIWRVRVGPWRRRAVLAALTLLRDEFPEDVEFVEKHGFFRSTFTVRTTPGRVDDIANAFYLPSVILGRQAPLSLPQKEDAR